MGQKSDEYKERNKGFDVLAFDGGGTMGVMEVVILRHIMNTATLLARNPKMIKQECIDLFSDEIGRKENILSTLADKLDTANVENPIHPTEVFDMIVGTSTGALISFGLVGGNCRNGKFCKFNPYSRLHHFQKRKKN